jgi:hypothetical protein
MGFRWGTLGRTPALSDLALSSCCPSDILRCAPPRSQGAGDRCCRGMLWRGRALACLVASGSARVFAFLPPPSTAYPPTAASLLRSGGGLHHLRVVGVAGARAEEAVGVEQDSDDIQARLSREWELDCYSRPVVGDDGKKLWELLICDTLGKYKRVEVMPSNMVNSRELRKLVELVSVCLPACGEGGA